MSKASFVTCLPLTLVLCRVGKKRKRVKGPDAANKLPGVTPHTKVQKSEINL